jgi:hypothetical protein
MSTPAAYGKIPLWLKLVYTAFLAVLVPCYWVIYGPINFLFFCDVALFLTLAALWLESPFLASMQAVGIILPQTLWVIDFFVYLFSRHHILGLADYMFDANIPLFNRALSSFHGWLPFLLAWMVWRLGYDRRAWLPQVALGWTLVLVCWFVSPAPPAPEGSTAPVNVNWVFGPGDQEAQTWMDPRLYLAAEMGVLAVIYLVSHLLFRVVFRKPAPVGVPLAA